MQRRKAVLREALRCNDIKSLDKEIFLEAWKAIAFLQPGLHPDEYRNPDGGWPEELKPFAEEAFRRRERNEISDEVLYPWEEALKGIKAGCH
jgi:hypothetical protein